jgi:uncharacterized membrane protein YgdD (TMEM256/DUF423 family)
MLKRSPPASFSRIAPRALLAAATLMGAAGVVFGALAAHGDSSDNLAVASSFLLFHAPAVLALAAVAPRSRLIHMAQIGLVLGTVLFSGTLALDAIAGVQLNPSPAPFGGLLMIASWLGATLTFLAVGSGD